jgi:type I restriction enzyme S subunit
MKENYLSQRRGVRQKNLNLGMIRSFELPVAEKIDQDEFVKFVEQIDKSKVAVRRALDETQTLYDSLMQEYFG